MPFKDPVIAAAYAKEYREKNRERLSAKNREYRAANPELTKLRHKQDYDKNSDAYKARAKASRERNLDKIKAFRSTPEYKARKNEARRKRYAEDENFRKSLLDDQKLFREENSEEINKRRKQRRDLNPEKYRGQNKAWTASHRDAVSASKARYYQKNKEHCQTSHKAYYRNNPDKFPAWSSLKLWERRYKRAIGKAMKKGATVVHSGLKEYYQVTFSSERPCEYCKSTLLPEEIVIDHKTPFNLGGSHEVSNLAVACFQCNSCKTDLPFDKWIERLKDRSNNKTPAGLSAEKYRKNNYWRMKFLRGLTYARSRNAEILERDHIMAFYKEVYSEPSGVCDYCRGRFDIKEIVIDHKQPFSLSGKHCVSNFALACKKCNSEKSNTSYDLWTNQ